MLEDPFPALREQDTTLLFNSTKNKQYITGMKTSHHHIRCRPLVTRTNHHWLSGDMGRPMRGNLMLDLLRGPKAREELVAIDRPL